MSQFFEIGDLDEIFIEEVFVHISSLLLKIQEWQEFPDNFDVAKLVRRTFVDCADCASTVAMQPMFKLCVNSANILQKIISAQKIPEAEFFEALLENCNVLPRLIEEFRAKSQNNFDVQPYLDELAKYAPVILEEQNEILDIFLEEAHEILERCTLYLHEWAEYPEKFTHIPILHRELHTFKGGARMADLQNAADLSHELENFYEKCGQRPLFDVPAIITLVQDAHDCLAQIIDAIQNNTEEPCIDKIIQKLTAFEFQEEPANGSTEHIVMNSGEFKRDNREYLRVQARDIDDLVNLSGESTVSRERLQQVTEHFSANFSEMRAVLTRLNDQVQTLEVQGDQAIGFRNHSEKSSVKNRLFDALEMDRYSVIQELTRSIRETTTDLFNIQECFTDEMRSIELLLTEQKQLDQDFHNLVMRTRMVHFDQIVPRLARIVRQVSAELGKKVELEVFGGQGEIDRHVLEHIIEPLEHLIRNAIDHGIENPEIRKQLGKTEIGHITIALERDGNDILIDFSDDGAGILLDVVRGKAIKKGLIDVHDHLTANQILRVIFQPGFTTSAKVTQISGRGVGLDVVESKIQQLNGEIGVSTSEGSGTTFVIRVPAALSVNNVLLVKTCDETFALPLANVSSIVHVDRETIEHFYKDENAAFMYQDTAYQLFYLGSLLGLNPNPSFVREESLIPIILLKGKNPIALQVDELLGSRQFVIKSLLQKLRGLPNISGVTIGIEGQIILVLDTLEIAKNAIKGDQPNVMTTLLESQVAQVNISAHRILIVDDSITIRKVTSRLLQRQGYFVQVAKDGVEALELIERFDPHLIIMDIEMPRMDGFECSRCIRQIPQFEKRPIVMITSRTGEKHREEARKIGVNAYFGKPFKNHGLLEKIEALLHEQ